MFAPESSTLLASAHELRSYCHGQNGNFDAAIFDADQNLKIDHKSNEKVMFWKIECLIQLKRYKEAMNFIKEIVGRISDLRSLHQKEIECKILDSQKHQSEKEVVLKDEEIWEDDFIEDAVEVKFSYQKGRYMIAKRDIGQGQVLMKEKPFISAIDNRYLMSHCSLCTKNVVDCFIPCDQCTKAVFCSSECKTNAWESFHKYECGFLDLLTKMFSSGVMVFRILFMVGLERVLNYLETGFSRDTDEVMIQFKKFCSFLDHRESESPEVMSWITIHGILMNHLVDYLWVVFHGEGTTYRPTMKLLFSYFVGAQLRCFVNQFGVFMEGEFNQKPNGIGASIVIDSSFINHSCQCNTYWCLMDNEMKMYAFENIKAGEEVSINYRSNESKSFRKRQADLMENYHFKCQCKKCIKDVTEMTTLKCSLCHGPVVCKLDKDPKQLSGQCFQCEEVYEDVSKAFITLKKHKEMLGQLDVRKKKAIKKAEQHLLAISEILYPNCNEMTKLRNQVGDFIEKVNQEDAKKNWLSKLLRDNLRLRI